jgi:sulfide:quinone oxidoreductase
MIKIRLVYSSETQENPLAKKMDYDVVIVGAGTAGIMVAARLKRRAPALRIALIDAAEKHYYQPLWTLVGAGVLRRHKTERAMKQLIPKGVDWIKKNAFSFRPDEDEIVLSDSEIIHYGGMVVCPGIEILWDQIKGLRQALGSGGVCSNYSFAHVEYTWDVIRKFRGGHAVFTFPNSPVKCGGAPQKIMYLAEHYFRKHKVRANSKVSFISAAASIFAVKKYADALNKIIKTRDMETLYRHNLVEIRAEKREAIFEDLTNGTFKTVPFDMLHVTPPMAAPEVIRQSPLANPAGWVDVDPHTLQHLKYKNVFSLGDASSLPTSKTGAAIRKQAPVLVENLLAHSKGAELTHRYGGYTSCPLVTGYGKLILAEFDYDAKPCETFFFDQSKERWSMYLLKKYLLPVFYWRLMMKGWG